MERAPWTMDDLLSLPRLAPYVRAVDGTDVAVMALYDWNTKISGAFFESLHYVEIGLRNALDGQLSLWANAGGRSWFDRRQSVRLTPSSRRRVEKARATLEAGGHVVNHGKIVAELTFGFWWSLLADEYNRTLWEPCLRFAFDGPVRRRRLHAELDNLRGLRNRIAHHEPIHHRDLGRDYRRLCDVASRISVELHQHVCSSSRIPQVLDARPDGATSR